MKWKSVADSSMTGASRSTVKLTHVALQRAIGYQFADEALLVRALTHRSFGADNNERLEFIGDGIVNAVAANLLYHSFPALDEGDLSRLRSKLVSKEGLARVAARFDLSASIRLGAGERKSGGRQRASILADAVEAIAGAVLIESGFDVASNVVATWFDEDVASLDVSRSRDAKTRLQEWLQGRGHSLPQYAVRSISGEDHHQMFDVVCSCDATDVTGEGSASSRKKAEQIAADALLEILSNDR